MTPKSNKNDKCHDCDKDVISNDKVPILYYDFLLKSDDSIQWICKGCKWASQKNCKMLTLMHQRQETLEKEVSTLTASYT